MEKEILFNWYSNMSESNKSQLKTLFNVWCLGVFNKTFKLNEDNLYTFLCDYFKFEFSEGATKNILLDVYNKFTGYYIYFIDKMGSNSTINSLIIKHIRENI